MRINKATVELPRLNPFLTNRSRLFFTGLLSLFLDLAAQLLAQIRDALAVASVVDTGVAHEGLGTLFWHLETSDIRGASVPIRM